MIALLDEDEHPPGVEDYEVSGWLETILGEPMKEDELRVEARRVEIPWAMLCRVAREMGDVSMGRTWSHVMKETV